MNTPFAVEVAVEEKSLAQKLFEGLLTEPSLPEPTDWVLVEPEESDAEEPATLWG